MTGAESRVNCLADALAKTGNEVHVLARKRVESATFCEDVHFHSSPWLREIVPDTMSPLAMGLAVADQFMSLGQLSSGAPFDIVQSSGMSVASYGLMLSRVQRTTCVLDEPDVEFEKARRMGSGRNSWRSTLLFEKLFARTASLVLTSSPREKLLMTSSFRVKDHRVSVVPNGVDTSKFAPSSAPAFLKEKLGLAGRKVVLFMGNFGYFPNVDSLNIITGELMPRVAKSVPSVKFVIIGRGLTQSGIPRSDNILPVGFVDDPRPYVGAADACTAPIRFGGGTRIKILEYMSMGRPVVSTSKGCEGISVTDGHDILIRDDWDGFAQATVRLLNENEFAPKMGIEARKTVSGSYEWSSIASKLIQTYEQMTSH